MNLFIDGLYDSICIWKTLRNLIMCNDSNIGNIYFKIILYNIICLFINIIIYEVIIPNCWFPTFIYYFTMLIWTGPHYLITIIYNSIYSTELIKLYIVNQNYTNNKYNCYSKYSEYLVNKFYYQLVILFLLLESIIVTQIPIIGKIIDSLFTSLVYSYYAWEYTWSQNKVPHRKRYDIFENNCLYYLGYSLILGLIKYYFFYFTSYHIISILFPFISLNCLNKFDKTPSTSYSFNLPIFRMPLFYTHLVINKLTKYLQKIQK